MKLNEWKLGAFELTWLKGGLTQLDGGAMFGVVPKPLWSKRYPVNELNQIPLRADPILLTAHGKTILIEAGMGNGRLTDKQKRNYGLVEESQILESLAAKGLTPADIEIIIMTHMHYDHCNGLVSLQDGQLVSTFPNAVIYVQEQEWAEMREPNIRSRNTYWEDNWRPIEQQVKTYQDVLELLPGISLHHTGGHSQGHAIVRLESEGKLALHLADIMPSHAHNNPLWVMAYDDYPMNSIFAKEKWIKEGIAQGAWFTFYHDAIYRVVKWNESGEIIDHVGVEL
ncbi:YtnP family quorum-quenching lactonase [Brevibacillus nitrificans]|uniref:YtnP family quorum-quenching lactonase n=1 Tax=Brevibacillus nitrificans TaxID=651560 RepID=UPI002633729A|nr:MBL fold metallo-hydrolase [Brevibacillus nitrificans]MED1792955.1 MBL fold metallo-hydrolase [Brevibacillus nitrificans]